MSFTFTIHQAPDGTAAEVFAAAGFPDVQCRENIDLQEAWSTGVCHFYRPQISCRTIEVTVEDDSFEVRLMAYSSPEDYRLGLSLVAAVARQTSLLIRSEEGDVVDTDAFANQFGEVWIDHMVRFPLGMFNRTMTQGGTDTLNGAIRPFVVGPNMLRELRFQEDRDGFPERFFSAMHKSQWLDLSDCFEASIIKITLKDSSETRLLSTVGAPGLKYLIQKVDFVGIQIGNDLAFIPWDRLANAFGVRLTRLDEELITIDPIEAEDWPAVGEHLKTFTVPLA